MNRHEIDIKHHIIDINKQHSKSQFNDWLIAKSRKKICWSDNSNGILLNRFHVRLATIEHRWWTLIKLDSLHMCLADRWCFGMFSIFQWNFHWNSFSSNLILIEWDFSSTCISISTTSIVIVSTNVYWCLFFQVTINRMKECLIISVCVFFFGRYWYTNGIKFEKESLTQGYYFGRFRRGKNFINESIR